MSPFIIRYLYLLLFGCLPGCAQVKGLRISCCALPEASQSHVVLKVLGDGAVSFRASADALGDGVQHITRGAEVLTIVGSQQSSRLGALLLC